MHLMKWFRKNNQKLMAIVVVVLMIGFIGGTALTRSCESLGQSRNRVTAYWGDNQKIRLSDIDQAQLQLYILQQLKADLLLRQLSVPLMQTRNLQGIVLCELLLPERSGSSMTIAMLKQARMHPNFSLDITDEQIYELLKRNEPPYIYWLLLVKEAEQNGFNVSKQQSEQVLRDFIPAVFNGASYENVIRAILNAPVSEQMMPVSRDQILTTFSKLIEVLENGRYACSTEDATFEQIKHAARTALRTLDVNYVRFDSDVFIKDVPEPSEQELQSQFDKYKGFFPGELSPDNPFGFGYKIPDSVQIQYLAVRISDVEKTIPKPTQEKIQEFYNNNKAYFVRTVPSDPNDPNSPPKQQIKPVAEVADVIEQALFAQDVQNKANQIIQRAISLTEVPQSGSTSPAASGSEEITAETFSKFSNNYQTAVNQLQKDYNTPIIVGQTGFLSAYDIQQDPILGRFIIKGPQFDPYTKPDFEYLYRMVFAINQLGTSAIDPINIPKPAMYKNIGQFDDDLIDVKIKAIFRVIAVNSQASPENINESFNKDTMVADPCSRQLKIYIVKSDVAKDIKKLKIYNQVRKTAEDFKKQVETTGDWQKAIDALNIQYPKGPDKKPTDPNNFDLVNLLGQRQIPQSDIYFLKLQAACDPALKVEERNIFKKRLFLEQLGNLAATEPNGPKTPLVWAFPGDMSFYCIKNISIKPVYQNQYENVKIQQMFFEDVFMSQSLAVVYYNPQNILKRLKFSWADAKKAAAASDANQAGPPSQSPPNQKQQSFDSSGKIPGNYDQQTEVRQAGT